METHKSEFQSETKHEGAHVRKVDVYQQHMVKAIRIDAFDGGQERLRVVCTNKLPCAS